MRISAYRLQRQIACSLLMFVALPVVAPAQQSLPSQQEGTPSVGQVQPSKSDRAADETTSGTTQSGSEKAPPVGSQTNPQESSQTAAQPVGTAAAPYEKTLAVAASRPAGAVIAPAKQRRTHSLLIKLGLLIGGAAAIGTVVALSKSSPSRPN